jgi:hypothetical protein
LERGDWLGADLSGSWCVGECNANAQIQIQDFTTDVLLNTGQWIEVESQATDPVAGAAYVATYANNGTATTSGGVVTANAPANGYVDHFYPETCGTFTPGTVEGAFVEAQMRTTDPSAELVGNLGADWWANSHAVYPNNAGAADSDWELLTTNWQTFYATSLTTAQLEANPPPGLEASTTPTTPTAPTTPTMPFPPFDPFGRPEAPPASVTIANPPIPADTSAVLVMLDAADGNYEDYDLAGIVFWRRTLSAKLIHNGRQTQRRTARALSDGG